MHNAYAHVLACSKTGVSGVSGCANWQLQQEKLSYTVTARQHVIVSIAVITVHMPFLHAVLPALKGTSMGKLTACAFQHEQLN